jgi:sugar transferase (PEP-CTERM/EpsH1 system associated)
MRQMLFLAHRFPYPPNKGERIRAWNLLQHFSRSWGVHFGCLSDDPADAGHLATVQPFCASLESVAIDKRRQKARALAGLRPGAPLMLGYYGHAGLHEWTRTVLARERIDLVYIFSTAMAPYVLDLPQAAGIAKVLDMQDIDSEKWREYAPGAGFPMRHVWAREARTLLRYERNAAARCAATLLVSEPECRRFLELAPELAGRVHAIEQGVDLDYFAPDPTRPSPYCGPAPQLALVGNMDYWPNADAAIWFAREVLPLLRRRDPAPEFNVVGANPGPEVLALAALPGVRVTGRVADVRPYVSHAAVSVTPLRIARGIQNKILEAMALARPVVTTPQGFEGVRATAGRDLLVADGAAALAAAVDEVLEGRHPHLGEAARAAVGAAYAWDGVFTRLDRVLDAALPARPALSGPDLSGPALSGPTLSGPASSGTA